MGEKPDVSHFCIFDSLVNFYVLDKKRKKLNPIIENGILWITMTHPRNIGCTFQHKGIYSLEEK